MSDEITRLDIILEAISRGRFRRVSIFPFVVVALFSEDADARLFGERLASLQWAETLRLTLRLRLRLRLNIIPRKLYGSSGDQLIPIHTYLMERNLIY